MKSYNQSIYNSSYYCLTSFPQALKFKILVKNKKVGTIEESMLRRELDSHGETGEISDCEYLSDEDETDDKAPIYPKSGAVKRKIEYKPPATPRKKTKVTFVLN